MKLTGNTILITGGGSGIGRGLAEAFHRLGNQVIVAGRRESLLHETTGANPGMKSIALDITDPGDIRAAAERLASDFPALNVVINNAGVMQVDDAGAVIEDNLLTATVTTNLLGPIRVTSALIEHLKGKEEAAVMYTTSVLGYVPLAMSAVYCSTKAALHSYILSQRYKLRGTSVRVIEIIPPWVQTDLLGSNNDSRAMPLPSFISQTMSVFESGAEEVIIENAKMMRNNVGPLEQPFITRFNDQLSLPAV